MPDRQLNSVIHSALLRLMATWSSPAFQATVARNANADIDDADIPVVFMLGMLGSTRASTLASELRLSRPTVSKRLARLTTGHVVRRVADPQNRRAHVVELAPRGRELFDALIQRGHAMVSEALEGWQLSETYAFAAQLDEFVTSLSVDVVESTDHAAPSSPPALPPV